MRLPNPLARLGLGLLACVGTVVLIRIGLKALFGHTTEAVTLALAIAASVLVIVVYKTLYRATEQRKIEEFSTKGIGKNLLLGLAAGVVLQTLTIGVMYAAGAFEVIKINPVTATIPQLIMATAAAITEETVFRGVIFRIAEERLGSAWALAISALIFGALHFANPHSSILAGLAIAVQAGVLLGAAYIYRRNLWCPIAMHFAWNFTQSGIFGAATSGGAPNESLLTTRFSGATALTGGDFGPEASVQATLFCLTAAVILLALSRRNGMIIPRPRSLRG